MENWERPLPSRHRRNPSFSSSLLDAIDRSIDESESGNLTRGARDSTKTATKARSSIDSPVTALNYYSYSCNADSARFTRPKPVRIQTKPNPARTDPLPPSPNPSKNPKKKLADFMRPKSTSPISPGAKLAVFLNSLFTPSNHKKPKISISPTEFPSPSPSPSICSSVSSYSRSCLSKTPSTRGSKRSARSVRFSPVGVIVGEDCRPCGEKAVFDGEAAAEEEEERRLRRRRAVEEMMKAFQESGEESDGSDDLFELENLGGVSVNGGLGLGLGFRDELPVFGTTDLGVNCAIAKGLVV